MNNKLLKILLCETLSIKNMNDLKTALDKSTDNSLVKNH